MVMALMRGFEDEMEGAGLPITWFDVLTQLSHAPGGRLQMKVLADLVVLSRSGLTRVIDRMEEAGLVRRATSSHSRREMFVTLTPEGRRTALRVGPGHHESIRKRFSQHLSDADLRALDRAIRKVSEGNRAADGRLSVPPSSPRPGSRGSAGRSVTSRVGAGRTPAGGAPGNPARSA